MWVGVYNNIYNHPPGQNWPLDDSTGRRVRGGAFNDSTGTRALGADSTGRRVAAALQFRRNKVEGATKLSQNGPQGADSEARIQTQEVAVRHGSPIQIWPRQMLVGETPTDKAGAGGSRAFPENWPPGCPSPAARAPRPKLAPPHVGRRNPTDKAGTGGSEPFPKYWPP